MINRSNELQKIRRLEETHFYFCQKRRIINWAIEHFSNKDARIIDLSCSAGVDIKLFDNAIGMDLDVRALKTADKYTDQLINADANDIPLRDSSVDIVLAMDLLSVNTVNEHKVIEEMKRILVPEGIILLNLPSLQFMFSRHDLSGRNKRRYSRKDVRNMFRALNWKIRFISHWTMIMLPIAVLQRKVIAEIFAGEDYSDLIEMPEWVNSIFDMIYKIEFALFKKKAIPFGLSLFAVVEKNEY